MTTTQFLQTYSSLPEALKKEAEHFVEFLAQKIKPNVEGISENQPKKERGGYGSMKGMFKMADDFDAPLDDFKDYM